MPHYLLSTYSTETDARSTMTDEDKRRSWDEISALEADMKSAGAWVFSSSTALGGHRDRGPPLRWRGRHDRRPIRRSEGAPRRLLHHQGGRPGRRPPLGIAGHRCDRIADRGVAVRRRRRRLTLADHQGRTGRARLPRGVRQVGRDPHPHLRRHRCRRGCCPGGVRARPAAVAGRWPPAEPWRLDHDDRAEPGDRPPPTRGPRAGAPRAAVDRCAQDRVIER